MMKNGLHFISRAFQAGTLSIFLTAALLIASLSGHAAPLCQNVFEISALKPRQMHYEILGKQQGTPLVLIHGVASSLESFRSVAVEIAKKHQVILYDLRGHGKTVDPMEGFQIDTQVKDLEVLLQHLKIQRFHLLGHSAGAKIAMAFATKHPEQVASMILEDNGALPMAKVEQPEIDEALSIAKFLRGLKKNYTQVKDLEADLAPLFPGDFAQAQELAQKVLPVGTRVSAVTKEFWVDFKAYDASGFLSTYKGPTLFLRAFPSTRYLTDRDVEQIQTQMPHAKLVNIPQSTHSIHVKQPRMWIEQVLGFLSPSL